MRDYILPAAMEPFRAQLEATRLDFIRVTPAKASKTTPWQSKVGGIPYWPASMPWPVNPDGDPLVFLAQINFSEIPALSPFPTKGIVQFFINDDDLLGMDFDDGEVQDTFRVVFHPDVQSGKDHLLNKLPEMPEEDDFLPHHPDVSHPLQFSMSTEVAAVTDYRFYEYFGADFFRQFGDEEWDIMDQFGKVIRPQGHKMGGYAYFTQDDPRKLDDPMLLLFQLDSDEMMDLMWGDMGVGHFFIRESDLKNLDFSRVLYDWDCL